MAYFEGIKMTGGYGNGPDIFNSCSVDVNKGEIVSILGPNGAGKSTAMKAMLGLLNLKSGAVKIDGKDIIAGFDRSGLRPFRCNVCYNCKYFKYSSTTLR